MINHTSYVKCMNIYIIYVNAMERMRNTTGIRVKRLCRHVFKRKVNNMLDHLDFGVGHNNIVLDMDVTETRP